MGSVFRNRVIFTYDAQISMTLRYDDKIKGIVFDHLIKIKNDPTEPYGPDGTYDALKIKKGKWLLVNDVDAGFKMEAAPQLPIPPK